ncbi:MAG: recombinase family protein [Azospirillaceae bacterium]
MSYVSYLRVSTDAQGRSGLGLEAQREACRRAAGDAPIISEYVEVESGRVDDRPMLRAAIDHAKKARATVLCAKLDRLGRRASHVLTILDRADVRVAFADAPNASDLELGLRAIIAQEEARLISERTKAGLAAARARGKRLGGLRPSTRSRNESATAAARERAERLRHIVEPLRRSGATLQGIADALDAAGVRTARGGRWAPQTVANLLKHLDGAEAA